MLTPEDIDHFKGQLEAQRETLTQRISALEQDLAKPDQWREAALERGDDADLLREHDDDWDRIKFARDELTQVEKALARIGAGTYGVSEVSGKPIPRERLEVEPSATTLVTETPPQP
jgi:RNA polymerase-binding transcription factor DksA